MITSGKLPFMQMVSISIVGVSPKYVKYYHFVTFLDSSVLSLPLSSILWPGQTKGPIFTLYGSKFVFPCKDDPFGSSDDGRRHLEANMPKTPQKWALIGNFKTKHRNITRNSSRDEIVNVNFLYDDIVTHYKIQ